MFLVDVSIEQSSVRSMRASARRALRVAIANIFKAKDPSLTSEKAMLAANITVHMVNGMRTLYAEAGPMEKPLIVAEYKKALTLHLGSVFVRGREDERSSKERQCKAGRFSTPLCDR